MPNDINPTLDALAKLYSLYDLQSVKFKQADEGILRGLSDRIYSLANPQEYEFSSQEEKTIERLWDEYGGV